MIPLKDNIPTDRFPFVTFALIVVNVIVYLLAIRHGGSVISGPTPAQEVKYGAIPFALTHPGDQCGVVDERSGARVRQGHAAGRDPHLADRVHRDVHARLDHPHRRAT